MGLHAEVPLPALAHLVPLRVAFPALIFGRGRCLQDGRVHDGAGADLQPMLGQIRVDPGEEALAQLMPFEQMTKLAHRRLVQRGLAAKVDTDKAAHRRRLVERVLNRRIGQVEPLLKQVNPQHPFQTDRRPSLIRVRVMRLDQRHQLRPRNHLLHLRKKLRAPRRPPKPLKATRHRQRLLLHTHSPHKHNLI